MHVTTILSVASASAISLEGVGLLKLLLTASSVTEKNSKEMDGPSLASLALTTWLVLRASCRLLEVELTGASPPQCGTCKMDRNIPSLTLVPMYRYHSYQHVLSYHLNMRWHSHRSISVMHWALWGLSQSKRKWSKVIMQI